MKFLRTAACALSVQHGTAACSRLAGCVHNAIGLPLARNYHYQLVRAALRRRALFHRLVSSQHCHCLASSYAFYRHGDDYPVPRYTEMQSASLLLYKHPCFLTRCDRKHYLPLARLYSEQLAHTSRRRSSAVHTHAYRNGQLAAELLKMRHRLGLGYRNNIVHADSSHSSIIS